MVLDRVRNISPSESFWAKSKVKLERRLTCKKIKDLCIYYSKEKNSSIYQSNLLLFHGQY